MNKLFLFLFSSALHLSAAQEPDKTALEIECSNDIQGLTTTGVHYFNFFAGYLENIKSAEQCTKEQPESVQQIAWWKRQINLKTATGMIVSQKLFKNFVLFLSQNHEESEPKIKNKTNEPACLLEEPELLNMFTKLAHHLCLHKSKIPYFQKKITPYLKKNFHKEQFLYQDPTTIETIQLLDDISSQDFFPAKEEPFLHYYEEHTRRDGWSVSPRATFEVQIVNDDEKKEYFITINNVKTKKCIKIQQPQKIITCQLSNDEQVISVSLKGFFQLFEFPSMKLLFLHEKDILRFTDTYDSSFFALHEDENTNQLHIFDRKNNTVFKTKKQIAPLIFYQFDSNGTQLATLSRKDCFIIDLTNQNTLDYLQFKNPLPYQFKFLSEDRDYSFSIDPSLTYFCAVHYTRENSEEIKDLQIESLATQEIIYNIKNIVAFAFSPLSELFYATKSDPYLLKSINLKKFPRKTLPQKLDLGLEYPIHNIDFFSIPEKAPLAALTCKANIITHVPPTYVYLYNQTITQENCRFKMHSSRYGKVAFFPDGSGFFIKQPHHIYPQRFVSIPIPRKLNLEERYLLSALTTLKPAPKTIPDHYKALLAAIPHEYKQTNALQALEAQLS